MKLKLPLSLRSILLRSLLIVGSGFAFQIQADTLTWKGGNGSLNDPDKWTDSGGLDATWAPGDDGTVTGAVTVGANGTMDVGGGSLTLNENGTLNGGSITGAGNIYINPGSSGTRYSITGNNILSGFTGDVYINAGGGGYVRLSAGSTDQSLGSGTIFVNGDFRIENAKVLTNICLNNGSFIASHSSNSLKVTNLEIGDGTATWRGRGDGAENFSTTFDIYGELSGGATSVLVLTNGTRDNVDYTANIYLHSANSYEGTLQVTARNSSGGSTLHLLDSGDLQYATVNLIGGTAGSGVRTGTATLSIEKASATVAELIGNSNSRVTSTVDSELTVKSGDYSGSVTGLLTIIKEGSGALTLGNATNTHTGGTIVREGILKLAETASAGTNLTIGKGATVEMLASGSGTYNLGPSTTLNISSTGTGTQAALDGNLNFSGGTFTFDGGWLTAPENSVSYFNITGDVTFTASTVSTLSLTGDLTSLTAGNYLLATANSIIGFDTSFWNDFVTSDLKYSGALSVIGQEIWLTLTSIDSLVWTGSNNGDGTWVVGDGTAWEGGISFTNGKTVSFNTLTSVTDAAVDITDSVQPSSIQVGGDGTNYTFSGTGSIDGDTTSLLKLGASTLTIETSNTYGGGTTISDGVVAANAANALGSGPITLNGGTLNANVANALGSGTVTLNGGILNANVANALGSNNITFAGGTLGLEADTTFSGAIITIASEKTANFSVRGSNSVTLLFATATDTSESLLTGNINKIGSGTLALRPDATATFTNRLAGTEGTLALDTTNGDITLNNTNGSFEGNLIFTGGGNVLINRNSFINSGVSSRVEVTSGTKLVFTDWSATYQNGTQVNVQLDAGSELQLLPTSVMTYSNRYWLGDGLILNGDGVLRATLGLGSIVLEQNLLNSFNGNIVVDSAGYVRVGNAQNGGTISLGNGTLFLNSGTRFFGHFRNKGTISGKIQLNDGAILTDAVDTNGSGYILNKLLTVGDGSNTVVTAYLDDGESGYIHTKADVSITINGGLAGGDNASFILRGTYAVRASGDPVYDSTRFSRVDLGGENAFSGTIQVQAHQGFWGNELHLTNNLAAQYATIDLQGNLTDYAPGPGVTGDKAGKAILSIDATDVKIAGLTGNADSLITSTVASTLTVNNDADNTYNGIINAGVGLALTKSGTGSLTLGGANTYAGGTTISGGIIIATSSTALGSGNVVLGSGATLQLGNASTPVPTLTMGGNLELNGGKLNLEGNSLVTAGANNTTAIFNIAGSMNFNAMTDISITGDIDLIEGGITGGDYLFAKAGAGIQNFVGNYTISPSDFYSLTINSINDELWLTVISDFQTWYGDPATGPGDGTWSASGGAGWGTGGTSPFINDNKKSVVFNTLSGVADATVTIDGVVKPNAIAVTGTTNYTFAGTGSIDGTASLIKSGTGTLTIGNANTYTGGTTVSQGTLIANAANALGSGPVTVNGTGILDANASLGSSPVTVQASGVLNANAALGNGQIALEGGTLNFNSGDAFSLGNNIAFSGGTLVYGSGVTEDISGIISGTARINTGANTVNWGTSLDQISGLTSLSKSGGGILNVNLDAPLAQNLIVSEGQLNIGTSTSNAVDLAKLQGTGGSITLTNNNTDDGVINLTGTTGYGGTLNLQAGTGGDKFSAANISFKTINLDQSELTVNVTGNSTGTALTSDGSGALIKTGAGTLSLDTFNNLKTVDVTQGELTVRQNGSTVNDLHVHSTLTLGSNSSSTVASSVSVSAANAYFYNGSTLNMVIPNQTAAIQTSGDIYLPDSMTVRMINYDPNQFTADTVQFTVMTANGSYYKTNEAAVMVVGGGPAGGAGGPVGGANDVLIANGTVFTNWLSEVDRSIETFYSAFEFSLVGDSVIAKAVKNVNTLARIANTANSMAGANLIWEAGVQQSGSDLTNLLNAITDQIASGNNAQASRLMAATVGSTYMGMLSAQKADFRYQQNLIRNRMVGMGLSQEHSYKGELPLYNAWIQGNGFYDKLDADGDMAGHDLNSWGGTVGFDMNVTPRLTLGAAMTVSHGDLKSSTGADSLSGDLDMYYVNLFGKYIYKKWTHSVILTGAWGEADVNRTVNYGTGAYSSSAKSDATAYGVFYEGTYDIMLNREKTAIFQPIVNAGITCNRMDGFSEKSTGNAGLNVDKMDQTMGTIGVGGRLLGVVGDNLFGREAVGELRALVVQDFGSDYAKGNVSYQVNPGFSQSVRGAKIGKTGVQLGAGITIPVGQQGSIFADAAVDLRSGATSVYGTIGYRYNF